MTELLILLALVLVNGIFSGAEIAIVAVRSSRLQELEQGADAGARAALALKKHPERFLATVQVGITVIGATAAAFGGASLTDDLVPLLERVGFVAPYAEEIALAAVIGLVSYFSIVLGELVPKSLALRGAERYALLVGRPMLLLSWLLRPAVAFLTLSSNAVLRPFGDETNFTETRHSPDELQQLVEEAARAGTLDKHAGEIAARALEFPELTAGDVMVPRPEVAALSTDATADDIRRTFDRGGHQRMPVCDGSIDNVVGYVSVKDLLQLVWSGQPLRLEEVMRPPFFVPETQRAVDLLQDMRRRRLPFAIVVDDQGGTSGIITTEDLIEELVGDIFSEHVEKIPQLIKREADGTALISGKAPLRDVNRALDLQLPEDGEWSTVAGLCLATAGRIPQRGDTLELADGLRLEIVDASPRRVQSVRLHRPPPAPDPA